MLTVPGADGVLTVNGIELDRQGRRVAVNFYNHTPGMPETLTIRLLTPELFLATKFEAYLGRGEGDLLASRDLEDILLVVDGREEIVAEVLRSDLDVRQFIAEQLATLPA